MSHAKEILIKVGMDKTVHILGFAGRLRKGSFNKAVLRAAGFAPKAKEKIEEEGNLAMKQARNSSNISSKPQPL